MAGEPGGKETCHLPRRRLRHGLREAQGPRLPASLAIGPRSVRGEGEEGRQDEIHMPGVRAERMGQAGYTVNLRRLLRGRRRRNLSDAGRAERRSRVTPKPNRGKTLRWTEGTNMTATLDWSQCPAVESIPGKRSGAWVFRGTRTPVSTVFENLQDMSVDELVEEFGVTREQVQAVLQFAAHSTEAVAPRP